MIRYDNTLVDLTSNLFVLCTNVKVYLYNYSLWVDLSMNIHEGKSYLFFTMFNIFSNTGARMIDSFYHITLKKF